MANKNDFYQLMDLRVATYNLHGFKSNWNYLQTILGVHDKVFVQELTTHITMLPLVINLTLIMFSFLRFLKICITNYEILK